ncbi:MAG: hypothetical protein K6F53_04880 [Lachnospiraceae bacterium]|nr:hypothetical protein [Lachnospiraceae bacterium]
MKAFIKRTLFLLLILTTVLIILDLLSMTGPFRTPIAKLTGSESYISENVGADEIRPFIEKAAGADKTTVLFLGDSVCRQLFNRQQENAPGISMIGSNAAITPAGQYILAKTYIDAHPDTSDIFLFMRPDSLTKTFDTDYGYQYTVMPFAETGTIGELDPDTIEAMEKVYGKPFMNPVIVRMIDRSGPDRKLYLNLLKEYSTPYEPDPPLALADRYIGKIKALCDEKGIRLHLHPCPAFESGRDEDERLRADYEISELSRWFPDYFEEIVYYPDEESYDGVHFDRDLVKDEYILRVIRECYGSFLLAESGRISLADLYPGLYR